jgi:hypothetical protein
MGFILLYSLTTYCIILNSISATHPDSNFFILHYAALHYFALYWQVYQTEPTLSTEHKKWQRSAMFIGKARSHGGEDLKKAVAGIPDRLVDIAYSLGAVLKDTVMLLQGFLAGSLYFTLLRNISFVEDAAQLSFSSTDLLSG